MASFGTTSRGAFQAGLTGKSMRSAWQRAKLQEEDGSDEEPWTTEPFRKSMGVSQQPSDDCDDASTEASECRSFGSSTSFRAAVPSATKKAAWASAKLAMASEDSDSDSDADDVQSSKNNSSFSSASFRRPSSWETAKQSEEADSDEEEAADLEEDKFACEVAADDVKQQVQKWLGLAEGERMSCLRFLSERSGVPLHTDDVQNAGTLRIRRRLAAIAQPLERLPTIEESFGEAESEDEIDTVVKRMPAFEVISKEQEEMADEAESLEAEQPAAEEASTEVERLPTLPVASKPSMPKPSQAGPRPVKIAPGIYRRQFASSAIVSTEESQIPCGLAPTPPPQALTAAGPKSNCRKLKASKFLSAAF